MQQKTYNFLMKMRIPMVGDAVEMMGDAVEMTIDVLNSHRSVPMIDICTAIAEKYHTNVKSVTARLVRVVNAMGCILILKWKSSVLHSDWINGRLNDSCMLRRGGLWANEKPLYLLCNVFGNAFELHLAVQLCPELTSKRR